MKERIREAANKIEPELSELSLALYNNPELGLQEYNSCKLHVDMLKKHGFDVEENYCGLPTGYKATYKSSKEGLTIAYLAEYDALPDIGHGCGHNLLGATSIGAGIVLKEIIDEVGGTVIVFGTPAEETCGGKVTYAEQGKFDDVDIAIIVHPSNAYKSSGNSMALEPLQFEFFGQTAHASSDPDKGINAMEAAVATVNNINALREHIRSNSRVHGVIIEAGKAANVVPDYAKVQYYVRSVTKTYNTELVEKIKNCAKAAALATGTRLEITKYEFSYDNLVTNERLSKAFADAIYEIAGIRMEEPPKSMGSTDTGQVSQVCPTIHPYFDITDNNLNITGHTREMADATITPFAKEQMKNTIGAMALTAYMVMTDSKLYAEIKDEFEHAEK